MEGSVPTTSILRMADALVQDVPGLERILERPDGSSTFLSGERVDHASVGGLGTVHTRNARERQST